jgi:hypothetical protein
MLLSPLIGLVRPRLVAALTVFELRRASGWKRTFGGFGHG